MYIITEITERKNLFTGVHDSSELNNNIKSFKIAITQMDNWKIWNPQLVSQYIF